MSESVATPQNVIIEFMTNVALIALQDQKVSKYDTGDAIEVGWEALSWLNMPGNFKYNAVKDAVNLYFSEEEVEWQ